MTVEKQLNRLVQRRVSYEPACFTSGELLDRLKLRQRVFRKYQPQSLDTFLRVETQPRIFRNFDYLSGRQQLYAIVRGRRREDGSVFGGTKLRSFVEDVQITRLRTAYFHADPIISFELELIR